VAGFIKIPSLSKGIREIDKTDNGRPEKIIPPPSVGDRSINKRIKLLLLLQMRKRILEARCNVQNMTLLDAKLTYIKAWQRLADSGIAYFIVMFKGNKKKVR